MRTGFLKTLDTDISLFTIYLKRKILFLSFLFLERQLTGAHKDPKSDVQIKMVAENICLRSSGDLEYSPQGPKILKI